MNLPINKVNVRQSHEIFIIVIITAIIEITYLFTDNKWTFFTDFVNVAWCTFAQRRVLTEPPKRLNRICNALINYKMYNKA